MLNNLVFFEGDDTEIVANRVAELFPIIRQRLAKEAQYGLCELIESGVVPIVCHPFVHNAPKALNRVQVGRICW